MAKRTKTLAEKELDDFDKVFKALAHPTRRHILIILRSRETKVTGDIVNKFKHQWPTISRHLRQLEDAGLLIVSKKGRQVIYSINNKRLHDVINNWLKWF